MKKIHFILAIAAIASFSACKKDKATTTPYTCPACTTTPDALAANDASSKGIYKGVVIGSSGTIMFDVANNGTTVTAVMVIDGVTVNLVSAIPWVAGPYTADFTGTLSGSAVTINLSVDLNGGSPVATAISIPGHPNASLTIIKETSAGLVECVEGTYSTTLPETGTFNIILSRSLATWSGAARAAGSTTTGSGGYGTISNNQLIDPTHNNRVIGTLNSDAFNGNFVDDNGITITLTGQRTL
jgi:hypothetical protein